MPPKMPPTKQGDPMSKANNKLTDTKIKTLKEAGKYFDGDGLYLEVTQSGSKLWRLKYRMMGALKKRSHVDFNSQSSRVEKRLSIGAYPSITLAQARQAKDNAKAQIANGVDPSLAKKTAKAKLALDASQTVKACALAWMQHNAPKWGEGTQKAVASSFERDVYPLIGNRAISTLTAQDVIKTAKAVETRGATDQAGRLLQRLKSFTRWATINQLIEINPSGDLKPDEILKKHTVKNRPALQDNQLHDFMERLNNYRGSTVVASCLRFLTLTALRPSEATGVQWTDIDFETATLTISANRMKMRKKHRVPLSKQALQAIEEMRPINGHRKYIFASLSKPTTTLSENTLNLGLQRMGFEATSHGMRATFSTIANESLNFKREVIERALSHQESNKVVSAYNRTDYFEERKKLMQWWANYLDSSARANGATLKSA